jgi:hypothetical protein
MDSRQKRLAFKEFLLDPGKTKAGLLRYFSWTYDGFNVEKAGLSRDPGWTYTMESNWKRLDFKRIPGTKGQSNGRFFLVHSKPTVLTLS